MINKITWGESFEVVQDINLLKKATTYEIKGIGNKVVEGKKYSCFLVNEHLIPKQTIKTLYEKRIIRKVETSLL